MNGHCTNCGTKLPQGAAFCTRCGQSLGRYCTSCGARVLQGAAYCVRCGSLLNPSGTTRRGQHGRPTALDGQAPARPTPHERTRRPTSGTQNTVRAAPSQRPEKPREERVSLRRLRSARAGVAGLAGSVQSLPYGQGLDFLRGFLGERMLSLRGFSRAARGLIYLAYALLVVMALWLLLLLLMEDGRSAQGPPSPIATLAVCVAFSAAWGLFLTGALHARRAVRLGVLSLYLIVTAGWVAGSSRLNLSAFDWPSPQFLLSILLALVGASFLLTVPVYFVLRRRVQLQPAVEFTILSLLVLVVYVTVCLQGALISGYVDDRFWADQSGPTLYLLLALAGLVFAYIGLDVAEILYGAAGVTTVFASARLGRRFLSRLLLLVLASQLCIGIWETVKGIGGNSLRAEAAANVAALGFPCIALVAWWLLERRRGPAPNEPLTVEQVFEVAKKWALLIVAIFFGVSVIGFLLVNVLPTIPFVRGGLGEWLLPRVRNYFGRILLIWQLLASALAVAVGVLMARRGHRAVALYLTILGGSAFLFLFWALVLHWWPERAGWGAAWARVDFWWAVAFALVGLFWLSRGRLTTERIQRLLLLSLITFGLYWIGIWYSTPEGGSNPEAGAIGSALVVIGILLLLWDLLTLGYWGNASSGGLPRISRIFLYLGFVVVCVTSLDWGMIVGISSAVEGVAQQTRFGFMFLARPLLYAIFVVTLALPTTSEEAGETDTVNAGE